MSSKAIEQATRDKIDLAKEYGVSISSIVWIGDNHYILIKNGMEIKI